MKYKFVAGHRYFTRISGVESLFTADANTASVAVTFGSDDIVDLTQMQSSDAFDMASAFSSMYPGHHPYDTGRLLNFTGTGIKTVGFNQWDEEWEIGNWSISTGQKGTLTDRIRCKNHIPVIPGMRYYVKIASSGRCCAYDSERNFLGLLKLGDDTIYPPSDSQRILGKTVFTMPNGVCFITFNMDTTYGLSYNHDICINLSWSGYRNGEYEPYWSATKSLPAATYFPDGMKSVGAVRDELKNGKAIQRCAKRTYQTGDEDDSTVVTDGTNTVYVLSSPVETVISPPLDLSFRSADYGTELLLPENDDEPVTTPMYADISYVQNLRDKLQRLPMSPSAEGDYIVHYDGVNQRYKAIPAVPSGDGVYALKCTVTGGEPVFAWVSETISGEGDGDT